MRARRPKAMPKGAVVSVNMPGTGPTDTYCRAVADGTTDESIRRALDRLLGDPVGHTVALAPSNLAMEMRRRQDQKRLEAEDAERARLIGAGG